MIHARAEHEQPSRSPAVQPLTANLAVSCAQEVHLDKNVKLLDSPGIVFPTAADAGDMSTPVAAALRNAVKLEKLDDPITPGEWRISTRQPNETRVCCCLQAESNRLCAFSRSPHGLF